MSDVLKKLTREMEKVQEPKRFVHTQGVEYTAAALAMRYGEDVERAQVAGLLHDCAKCMGNDKLLSACEKHHIPVTDVERRNPYLLHPGEDQYHRGEKKDFRQRQKALCHEGIEHPGISCHDTGGERGEGCRDSGNLHEQAGTGRVLTD